MGFRKNIQEDPVKAHKRQAFWRIYLPLGVILLVMLAIGFFFTFDSISGGSLSTTWSSIALILLIGPFVMVGIITLVILVLSVIGLDKANKVITPKLRGFRVNLLRINTKAQGYADRLVSPIITGRSLVSGFISFLNLVFLQPKIRRNK